VTELIEEISNASAEQTKGIEKVNQAVAEMDKVTQDNAANAEQSASAAVELETQAEQMEGVLNELIAIVGTKGVGGNGEMARPIEVSDSQEGAVGEQPEAGVLKVLPAFVGKLINLRRMKKAGPHPALGRDRGP
jgi:hypothetical protein